MKIGLQKILYVVALAALSFATVKGVVYWQKSTQPASKDLCSANLKQLAGAIENWALQNHKTTNDVPTWDDLLKDSNASFPLKPTCPRGGIYELKPVGQRITCSHCRDSIRMRL